MKADFSFELATGPSGPVVVVIDQSGAPSVTNAAESTINQLRDELRAGGMELAAHRVIYRDHGPGSCFDELQHDGRAFTRFRILNARTPAEAMQRLAQAERPGIAPPILPGRAPQ